MKILKAIFWTTVFWLLIMLIVFVYAKYTKWWEGLANSIAKNLWVQVMTTWSMMSWDTMSGAVSEQYTEMMNSLELMNANIDYLVEEQMKISDATTTTTNTLTIKKVTTGAITSDTTIQEEVVDASANIEAVAE